MSTLEAYASIEGGVKAAGEEEEEGCKLVYLLLDSGAKILLPLRLNSALLCWQANALITTPVLNVLYYDASNTMLVYIYMCDLLFYMVPQGIDKHAILRSTLPSIGADLKFQRLYTEYKDQLDSIQGT